MRGQTCIRTQLSGGAWWWRGSEKVSCTRLSDKVSLLVSPRQETFLDRIADWAGLCRQTYQCDTLRGRESSFDMARQPRPKGKTLQDLAEVAIAALKSKQGSSVPAILKFLNATYHMGNSNLGPLIRKALASGVKKGRFEQVRSSFKLSREYLRQQAKEEKQKAQEASKKKKGAEAARKRKAAKKQAERAKANTKRARGSEGKKKPESAVKLIDDSRLLTLERKRKKSPYLELPAPYEVLGCGEDGRYLGDYLFVLSACITLRDHVENAAFFRLCDLKAAIGGREGITPMVAQLHIKLLRHVLAHVHADEEDSDDDSGDGSDDSDDSNREAERRRKRKEKQSALLAAAAAAAATTGEGGNSVPAGQAAAAPLGGADDDATPFQDWWLEGLNETTWPHILCKYVEARTTLLREQAQRDLWSSAPQLADTAKRIEELLPEVLPLHAIQCLGSHGYASLEVGSRLQLLCFLCNEALGVDEVAEAILDNADAYVFVLSACSLRCHYYYHHHHHHPHPLTVSLAH